MQCQMELNIVSKNSDTKELDSKFEVHHNGFHRISPRNGQNIYKFHKKNINWATQSFTFPPSVQGSLSNAKGV